MNGRTDNGPTSATIAYLALGGPAIIASNNRSVISVVATIRFTVGDHIIIKCSCINKMYEANHFLKMFPDTG